MGTVCNTSPQPYLHPPNLPSSSRYLLEHGLKADGRPDPDTLNAGDNGSFETFFTDTGSGKYVPRSIFVDLDPSVRRDSELEGWSQLT